MNIKIKVINALNGQVEIDSEINVNGDYAIAEANHNAFSEMYPDCQVNFVIDNDNFIFAPPVNMMLDEQAYENGEITWNEYCNKWYKGSLSGCNDDDNDGMSNEEIERQVDMLLEEEWEMRDSICY
jgi:hypothetical protein